MTPTPPAGPGVIRTAPDNCHRRRQRGARGEDTRGDAGLHLRSGLPRDSQWLSLRRTRRGALAPVNRPAKPGSCYFDLSVHLTDIEGINQMAPASRSRSISAALPRCFPCAECRNICISLRSERLAPPKSPRHIPGWYDPMRTSPCAPCSARSNATTRGGRTSASPPPIVYRRRHRSPPSP
jgi:hypothetical protein